LQGSLLQIDIAKIIVDEADEPNSPVDLLDAEPLSGEGGGDINFLAMQAQVTDPTAGSGLLPSGG
jgi:hypothetical protein